MEQIIFILTFILNSFIHVWPYLLITIPLAVWVKLSDFSKHFQFIMTKSPWLSILMATAVGAISPFCSCGVIPVISSLLIGGVPLAPVFAFWVASPSMDPEIFFLSVSILGWKLAVWRLASTFALSIMAGVITHLLVKSGYLTTYLREKKIKTSAFSLRKVLIGERNFGTLKATSTLPQLQFSGMAVSCCPESFEERTTVKSCECPSVQECNFGKDLSVCINLSQSSLWRRIGSESIKSVWMISKFMGLAFFLNALLTRYVPHEWFEKLLTGQGLMSVIIAAIIGIPVYTSNLAALPMVGGLLHLGLHPGAALAFMISGPLTTIPAMAVVYGIATKKVFGMYVSFALFGSLFFGLLYYFLGM